MSNLPMDNTKPLDSAGSLASRPSTDLAASPRRLLLQRSPESPRAITVRLALNALSRWWKVALPVGLLLSGIGGALVWALFEPRYEASSLLRIEERAEFVAFPENRGYSGRFVQTQIELMRSRIVLGPVIAQPEIARLPELAQQLDKIGWIGKRLNVRQVGQSELYAVSLPMADPEDSRHVVDAVVSAYLDSQETDDSRKTRRTLDLLEKQQKVRAEEVRQLQEDVRQRTKEATGKDIYLPRPEPDAVVQNPLGQLDGHLVIAIVECVVLQAKVTSFEEMIKKQPAVVPEETLERVVEQNPKILELKAKVLFGKEQLVQNERVFQNGGANPSQRATTQVGPFLQKESQRLQERIAEDEKTLESVRATIRKEAEAELKREFAARRNDQLASLRMELETQRIKVSSLQQQREAVLAKAKVGSTDLVELEFKRNELKLAQDVRDLITKRVTQIKTEQGAPSPVARLAPADSPLAPVEIIPYRKMALACLAGLCLPFVLSVAWERMIRRVSESADLEHETQLTVVGEVSRLPSRRRSARASVSSRVSADIQLFEESIDSLRTNLLLPEHLKDMKVFAVTSASSHEGKTSVAVSLAVSLARASGQATLLIDGDMRSPDIHELFDTRLEPGLAEVLKGESDLEGAIITSCSASVHLLPAGKLTTSPHTLLGNGAFRALVREASTKYRYCVVDTPPVLSAAESLVMAKVADACLICAMRNVSRGDYVRKACERLVASGSRPVGAVLNGVPRSRYEYRHARYYYPHP